MYSIYPHSLRFIVLLSVLSFGWLGAKPVDRISSPLFLEGAEKSQMQMLAQGGVIYHTLESVPSYSTETLYGWVKVPEGDFGQENWLHNREVAYTQGVSDKTIEFQAALSPGEWTVVLLLDAGYLDFWELEATINQKVLPMQGHAFDPPAEPENLPINRYRVIQERFEAGSEFTNIRLQHPSGSVRLLGLYLIPVKEAESPKEQWFLKRIHELGVHRSEASLDSLLTELFIQTVRAEDPTFYAYWLLQVQLLIDAERYYRLLGWDYVRATTQSSIFTRFKQAICILDGLTLANGVGEQHLLYDRAYWLRAKLLYWVWKEQHFPNDLIATKEAMSALLAKFPDDQLVQMYAGQKIPAPGIPEGQLLKTAPEWSQLQLEVLYRLRHIAYYWIQEKQITNGEMGGKADDDVEMLRWWRVPAYAGDPLVRQGFKRLADGMWYSTRVENGYSVVPRDVEHSAEPISDTAPDAAVFLGGATYVDRLRPTYHLMKHLWTGVNDRGYLQFKSAWIGSRNILTEPPRNRDLAMNSRAIKALRYLAMLDSNPAYKELLTAWADAWLDAAQRTDKGKPYGLFPSSMRYPDAAFNGDLPTWYNAQMYWPYFEWRGDGKLYDQLFYSYTLSREEKYLEPLIETLKLIQRHFPDARSEMPDPAEFEMGSEKWAAAHLLSRGAFWSTVTQWRMFTGDRRFDDYLLQVGPSFLKYWLSKDTRYLSEGIQEAILEHLAYNLPLKTTEVLFTDRVHVSTRKPTKDGTEMIMTMLTGSAAENGMSPYMSHIWLEAPESLTSLITEYQPDQRAFEVFLHQEEKANIRMRFFRLPEGKYELRMMDEAGVKNLNRSLNVGEGVYTDVELTVPGNQLLKVIVSPINE